MKSGDGYRVTGPEFEIGAADCVEAEPRKGLYDTAKVLRRTMLSLSKPSHTHGKRVLIYVDESRRCSQRDWNGT